MSAVKADKTKLEARAEEIRFLGTQYAMNGITPPSELEEEFRRIQAALGEGQAAPRDAARPGSKKG